MNSDVKQRKGAHGGGEAAEEYKKEERLVTYYDSGYPSPSPGIEKREWPWISMGEALLEVHGHTSQYSGQYVMYRMWYRPRLCWGSLFFKILYICSWTLEQSSYSSCILAFQQSFFFLVYHSLTTQLGDVTCHHVHSQSGIKLIIGWFTCIWTWCLGPWHGD